MDHPFRMLGRKIEIYRYKAGYKEKRLGEGGQPFEETVTGYFTTIEEAEAKGGKATELDVSSYEWLDGIRVADVPDTYAEAVRICEMGQEAFEAETRSNAVEKLRADLDYVMLMGGFFDGR